MLQGKKILIAVTGSIAAYKVPVLLRLFVKNGAEVQVLMTESARDFVSPLTLATLSRHPVLCTYYETETGTWHNHVNLGLWADLMLIAPATANTLAKMAAGICDSLVLATYISARCPVWVAPAMDLDMWAHSSTQKNISILTERNVKIIDPESGFLASGLEGKGRMAEPETILTHVLQFFKNSNQEDSWLYEKKVLITAGPTREPLDPVRYISNRSTGKMGIALADEALKRGAKVSLIHGPLQVTIPKHPNLTAYPVETARHMYEVTMQLARNVDIAVFAAAVADYTVAQPAAQKTKKSNGPLEIKLIPTPDIAHAFGKQKKSTQISIGFALETNDGESNAQDKLHRKNLDMIVLNSLQDPGSGFEHDTNKVTFFFKNKEMQTHPLLHKKDVANLFWQTVCTKLLNNF